LREHGLALAGPPAGEAEIQAAALQFVRKVSGFNKPSTANEKAFQTAVAEITAVTRRLLEVLATSAPAKNRDEETAKAHMRTGRRSGQRMA
jgi:hypothetical protein